MDIPTPNTAALQITEFLLPYIGMVMIVIIGFMIKDYATKLSKGIAFSWNKQFKEGDKGDPDFTAYGKFCSSRYYCD